MKAWREQSRDRAQNPGAHCITAATHKQAVRAAGSVMKGEKALKGRRLKLGENNSRSSHANTLLVGHGTGGAWQYYH